jgi:alpha-tubulin suppressor-like RCC1 family protein
MRFCLLAALALLANGCAGAGDATNIPKEPIPEACGPAPVARLALGWEHSCARLTTGAVCCWGGNDRGQLGVGASPRFRTHPLTPSRVVGIEDAVDLASAVNHTCAIRKDRSVACWGNDESGQLGDGKTLSLTIVPTRAIGLGDAATITVGFDHSCASTTSGDVYCWGKHEDALGEIAEATRASSVTMEGCRVGGTTTTTSSAERLAAAAPRTCAKYRTSSRSRLARRVRARGCVMEA